VQLVEFLGAPGSGKTTVFQALVTAAHDAGLLLHELEPVGRAAFAEHGRDPLARAVARTIGKHSPAVWKKTMARSSDRVAILSRAITSRPRLAAAIIASNQAHNADAHADVVLSMTLNHLISFQLAEESLGSDEWLLVDEGLCHRVIGLFAASSSEIRRSEVVRYLDLVPVPRVLVVVSAPVDLCLLRREAGGWSAGRIHDPSRRRSFLERSSELVELTSRHMEEEGSAVVRVDGSREATTGVPAIIDAIRGAAAAPELGRGREFHV
jgi:hypothetical protein